MTKKISGRLLYHFFQVRNHPWKFRQDWRWTPPKVFGPTWIQSICLCLNLKIVFIFYFLSLSTMLLLLYWLLRSSLSKCLQDWIFAIGQDLLTFKLPKHTFPSVYHWQNWSRLTLLWSEMIHPRLSINDKVLPVIW